MFPECDCVSWLISDGALQHALGSHRRGIWASLEVRKGISDEVPIVCTLTAGEVRLRGKGAKVGVSGPNQKGSRLL